MAITLKRLLENGLEYVGCEIDKDYLKFANERLTRIL